MEESLIKYLGEYFLTTLRIQGGFYVGKRVAYDENSTTYVPIYFFFLNICNNKSVREVEDSESSP